MEMRVIRNFLEIKKELKENGVIGLNIWDDRIHLTIEKIIEFPNLTIKNRNDIDYPFEVTATEGGVNFFALATYDQVRKYRLQAEPATEASPDGL